MRKEKQQEKKEEQLAIFTDTARLDDLSGGVEHPRGIRSASGPCRHLCHHRLPCIQCRLVKVSWSSVARLDADCGGEALLLGLSAEAVDGLDDLVHVLLLVQRRRTKQVSVLQPIRPARTLEVLQILHLEGCHFLLVDFLDRAGSKVVDELAEDHAALQVCRKLRTSAHGLPCHLGDPFGCLSFQLWVEFRQSLGLQISINSKVSCHR